MTKQAKSRSLRALTMKNELFVSIDVDHDHFLSTNRELACTLSFFLIGPSRRIKKDTEGKEGRKTQVVANDEKKKKKKKDDNDEREDFLSIILTFSRARLFSPFLSLSLSFCDL